VRPIIYTKEEKKVQKQGKLNPFDADLSSSKWSVFSEQVTYFYFVLGQWERGGQP